jgi:tetratricopeptide (TPR) repeat protein
MRKEPLLKLAAAGLALIPCVGWSQESGFVPDRLGIGNNQGASDVRLTRQGEVLPGDLGSAIPDNIADPNQPSAEEEIAKVVDQLPDSVMKLTRAQKIEITTLIREAAVFIQGIRLQEGLDRLIKVEALTKDFFQTYNLRGAIYTKLREFDKARAAFSRAVELNSNLMEARFNLAELDFVEKKFASAEQSFLQLFEDFPNLVTSQEQRATKKLIDYKIFIAVLLQSQQEGDAKEKQAMALLEQFDWFDDYPVFYYANAALEFHRDNQAGAEEWMSSAAKIYDRGTQSLYVDALIEMGWVEAL